MSLFGLVKQLAMLGLEICLFYIDVGQLRFQLILRGLVVSELFFSLGSRHLMLLALVPYGVHFLFQHPNLVLFLTMHLV